MTTAGTNLFNWGLRVRLWHKADMLIAARNVRFRG